MTIWNKDKTEESIDAEINRTLKMLFDGKGEIYCTDCGSTNVRVREKK